MENEFITVEELQRKVQRSVDKASVADLKWLYCYFSDFEEFPLTIDALDSEHKLAGLEDF